MLSATFICRFRSNNTNMVGLVWNGKSGSAAGVEFPVVENITNEQLDSVHRVCKFVYKDNQAVYVIDARKQLPMWIEKAISINPYSLKATEFVEWVRENAVPTTTRLLVNGAAEKIFGGPQQLERFYGWLCGTPGSWSGAAQLVVNVNEDGREMEKCPICWGNGCDWKLHCTHVFHLDCLKMWENNGRDTCPYCRRIARF